MGRRHQEEELAGEDSFLDTIANLIGIIIILVVIVGAKSQSSAREIVGQEIALERDELKDPLAKALQLEDDLAKQAAELQRYELELAYRSNERMMTLDQVNVAKSKIDGQVNELSEEERNQFEIDRELSELEQQLADLMGQQGTLPDSEVPPIVLHHLPTPMAKTVFGHEIHVMMTENKVSVIPWNELVDSLKREARGAVERNTQRDRFTNELGPIGGFTMKYTLKSQTGMMSDGARTAMGRMVELDRFVLTPEPDLMKETVEQTLSTGGRLRAELAMHKNQNTTVTVWVYPDSFSAFRKLKDTLFPEGFLCAARPLPFGVPVGASPNGSSSTAQ
ncbi:MAG: hypothetical protein ACK5YR_21185 [Pirellula sp.]|jgi:hypothetical protein